MNSSSGGKGSGGAGGAAVQGGRIVPVESPGLASSGVPAAHEEFLQVLCTHLTSKEIDDVQRPPSPNNPHFKWWQNPFIPEPKRLYLEFLATSGLLNRPHRHIPHQKFIQMWLNFLASKGVTFEEEKLPEVHPLVPFRGEFNNLWVTFLDENGLLNRSHAHIPHRQFMHMWAEFVKERTLEHIPAFHHEYFTTWWQQFFTPPVGSGEPENALKTGREWWMYFNEKIQEFASKMRRRRHAPFRPVHPGFDWRNNPFIPEWKRKWLRHLESTGVQDPERDPIPERSIQSEWNNFVSERGSELSPDSSYAANRQFLIWWFTRFTHGQLTPVESPDGSGISRHQFVEWWNQFHWKVARAHASLGQKHSLEAFLNWWFAEQNRPSRKISVAAVDAVEPEEETEALSEESVPEESVSTEEEESVSEESEEDDDSWKNNPFIPKPVRMWLQFLEEFENVTNGKNVSEEEFNNMWLDFLVEQEIISDPQENVTIGDFFDWWFDPANLFSQWGNNLSPTSPQLSVSAFGGIEPEEETDLLSEDAETEEDSVSEESEDDWKNNPFIPKPVRLWLEFLEEFNNVTNGTEVPEANFTNMWLDFLVERDILPDSANRENMTIGSFFEWWFSRSIFPASGSISASALKKTASFPHEEFLSQGLRFLEKQLEPGEFTDLEQMKEHFLKWWFEEIYNRFIKVGEAEAKAYHIPHQEFLHLMCESLLSGSSAQTPEETAPEQEEGAVIQNAAGAGASPGATTTQSFLTRAARRMARRVLRSVPLIDG